MYDCSLYRIGAGTSMEKSGGVKLVYRPKPKSFNEICTLYIYGKQHILDLI